MKKTLVSLAMLAAFGASAQTNIDSTSGSNSNAGANSGSASAVIGGSATGGQANVTATGNQATSGSQSGSMSGATSDSRSGALGNVVNIDQRGPTSQTISQTQNSTSNATVNGHTTEDVNVRNSGVVEQRASGGYTNSSYENINYSGSQTVKNVPSIAMSGPASGPCTGNSGGIGLAGPGWGFGLNGSAVMLDCRLRENTRVLGMGMQSLDGAANPQEKGEATVMFMDAMRALAAYNNSLAGEIKQGK